MDLNFDIGIVGSGPAGYTAALHARRKGLSVVLFEKEQLGGVCLNRGCIPTKAILRSVEVYEDIMQSETFGIKVLGAEADFEKIMERKNQIVSKLRKGLELSLKNSGVNIVFAEAQVIDKNSIKADNNLYKCSKIVVATGSEPKQLKGLEFDHEFVLNSDDILCLEKLPEDVVIIGSGAIGIEWARIFSGLGVNVSIIELAQNLLPIADIEVSKRIERIFKAKKIKIYKGVSVDRIDKAGSKVFLSNGEAIESQIVLSAVGRHVSDYQKIDGVEYIGDITKEIQLAHFASKQAIEVIDGVPFNKKFVPSVVYGNPEIAWIGEREQDLEPDTYKKSMMLISALGKSQCDGAVDGFIKILVQNNDIVGVHIVSKEASAMIQQVGIAMQNGLTVDRLKEVCFAHPTYSEGIFDSLFNL